MLFERIGDCGSSPGVPSELFRSVKQWMQVCLLHQYDGNQIIRTAEVIAPQFGSDPCFMLGEFPNLCQTRG